ncbi:MAG TPA: hypothetical protein VHI98_24125 [Vicinamibacterales bacterium]|nr:hypothetical protein [Vicinamibacterales bacterium]
MIRSSASRRIAAGSDAASGLAPEALSRHEHPRADHLSHRDEIPHSDVGITGRVQIPDRCDAAFERTPRVLLREKYGDSRMPSLSTWTRPWLAVPVVGDVRVDVDETRKARVAPEIDDPRALRQILRTASDAHDAAGFDDDDGIVDDAGAIPEPAEADHLTLSEKDSRRGGDRADRDRAEDH